MYKIKGFRQLYGETVIESHRLLKNGSGPSNYILITEDYFKALNQTASDVLLDEEEFTYYCSDFFTGLRKIAYYFYSYFPNKCNKNYLVRA